MSIHIEKDRDYSDVEIKTKSHPSDRFSIHRDYDDFDVASVASHKSREHDARGLEERSGLNHRPKLSLETAGVDLLISDGRDRNKEHETDTKSEGGRSTSSPPRISVDLTDDDIGIHSKYPSSPFRHSAPSPRHSSHDDHYGHKEEAHDDHYGHRREGSHDDHARDDRYYNHESYADQRSNSRPDHDYDARSDVSHRGLSQEEIDRQKREILILFERLEKKKVFIPKKFTMDSPLEDMKYEYEKLKSMHDAEAAIKFYRNILMAFVSGAEFVNDNYNPYKLRLEGWSEGVIENIDNYDDVFEELHLKYATRVKIPPELKLLGMVVGSGFMTHLTNSIFKSSSLPNFGDVMKDNPDLMREFQKAAVHTTANKTPGMGGIFGMMNQMGAGIPTSIPTRDMPAPQRTEPVQRREMRGPSNVDDILNTFKSQPEMTPAAAERPISRKLDDDIKSVNLSEINDFDRISDISSLAESDLKRGDIASRPGLGIRPTHREAFINKLKTKRKGRKGGEGGLIIDI